MSKLLTERQHVSSSLTYMIMLSEIILGETVGTYPCWKCIFGSSKLQSLDPPRHAVKSGPYSIHPRSRQSRVPHMPYAVHGVSLTEVIWKQEEATGRNQKAARCQNIRVLPRQKQPAADMHPLHRHAEASDSRVV